MTDSSGLKLALAAIIAFVLIFVLATINNIFSDRCNPYEPFIIEDSNLYCVSHKELNTFRCFPLEEAE